MLLSLIFLIVMWKIKPLTDLLRELNEIVLIQYLVQSLKEYLLLLGLANIYEKVHDFKMLNELSI